MGTKSERPNLDKLIGKRSKSGGFNRSQSLSKEYRVLDGDRWKSLTKPQEIEEKRRKNKIAKSKIIYLFSWNFSNIYLFSRGKFQKL